MDSEVNYLKYMEGAISSNLSNHLSPTTWFTFSGPILKPSEMPERLRHDAEVLGCQVTGACVGTTGGNRWDTTIKRVKKERELVDTTGDQIWSWQTWQTRIYTIYTYIRVNVWNECYCSLLKSARQSTMLGHLFWSAAHKLSLLRLGTRRSCQRQDYINVADPRWLAASAQETCIPLTDYNVALVKLIRLL